MESKTSPTENTPPRLIPTLVSGFNTVANNVYLLILPIVLDLMLWLAPHLRVKDLLQPTLDGMMKQLITLSPADMKDQITLVQTMWQDFLARYNLLGSLQSFPFGIPSLFARGGTLETPFGTAPVLESSSLGIAFLIWLACSLLGLFLVTLYFYLIARSTEAKKELFALKELARHFLQMLTITIGLILALLLLSMPALFFFFLMAMINPGLAQFAILLIGVFLVWLLIPLVFSSHGIFVYNQRALNSMLTSVRLVRFLLPSTGFFLLTAVLLSEGLNLLWLTPSENSWLMLLGIFGHAFISTGLITASVIYYKNGVHWMQETLQRLTSVPGIKI